MATYYETLGLEENATLEDIKTKYKKLSLKYHPDRNRGKEEWAKKKFQEIKEAYEKLCELLGKGGGNSNWNDDREPCHNEGGQCKNKCVNKRTNPFKIEERNIVIGIWENYKGERWFNRWGEPNNYFFFCSQNCLNQFKVNSLFRCQGCKNNFWEKKAPKNVKNDLNYCSGCFFKGDNTPNEDKKPPKNKKILRPGGGRCPGEYCGGVREATGWKQGGSRNKWYCEFCWGAIFGKEENENNNDENGNNEDNNENHKNLQSEIQKAIQEIETELNKEPKITTQDDNWRTYIENSSTLIILQSRKQKVLDDIQEIRKQQGGGNDKLAEVRLHAIHLINRELEQNSISANQLANPNWENDIKQVQSKDAILDIQNQVLANIKNIKTTVEEINLLQELLLQAKQAENWNNYQNLENIFKKIKAYRSSNAYQAKKSEIQTVENRLRELNSTKFKETEVNLLDQRVKDSGLTNDNMDEETKAALALAKQNPTPENLTIAEEKVAQNGANNNLNNLVTQIESKLKKGVLTKKDKEKMAAEILQFITKNNYQVKAYENQKSKIDKLLAELNGETSNQKDTRTPFIKIFGIATLIALPLIILAIIILRVRRQKLARQKMS